MNQILVVLIAMVLTICVAEHYTDRYDDINIDEILANRRLLGSYVKCVLDQGRCTPEGKELRAHIKDGMETGCQKCTEKQQKAVRKVVKHIREKETEFWDQILKKYDPEDEYKEAYEKFLAGDNVKE